MRLPSDLPQAIGRFRILGELGRGGMGVVYRGVDSSNGALRAVKVLLATDHVGDASIQRFLREAETARRIHHPNVVGVYDLGWHDGRPYLTMDLVEGGSLEPFTGPTDPSWAARTMAGVAHGLHAAHLRGLAHRDVKPGNILLDGDTPRLTDFGLARELSPLETRLTATGQVLGTPTYMAPEQSTNEVMDAALTDQYSVGAVLYELLAGRPPYLGEHAVQVMLAITRENPPSLRAVAPQVPLPLVRIVEKAMARVPERRYASCGDLADDLERFLSGAPIVAAPPGLLDQVRDRVGPLGRLAATIGCLVAAVGLLGAGTATVRNDTVRRNDEARTAAARRDLGVAESEAIAAVASGNPTVADAAITAFADRHPGTPAATGALLRQAARHETAGDRRGQVALLSEAYSQASRPDEQDRVLTELAVAFEGDWNWRGLATVVDTLARRHPARTNSPAALRPLAATLLATGDAAGAASAFERLGEAGPARLALHLTTGTAGPEGLLPHAPVDWDGDGSLDGVAWRDGRLEVLDLVPGFPVDRVLWTGDPDGPRPSTLLIEGPHRRATVFVEGVLTLVDASQAGEPRVLTTRAGSEPKAAAQADLDGDGTPEVYVGFGPYDRRLLVTSEATAWTWRDAHPATNGFGSDIVDLQVVPGPTGPDLWVAVGPWSAYDVRRLRAQDGVLQLLDRRRLGYVPDLLALHDGTVAALHSPEYPSLRAFPAQRPLGEATGLWLLDPNDASTAQHVAIPGPYDTLDRLVEADVDGDGILDLTLNAEVGTPHQWATLVFLGGPRRGPPLILSGQHVIAAAQLDPDPAAELLVQDQWMAQTFVLGLGSTPTRPQNTSLVAPHAPPADLAPDATAAWERAEDLVAMGLLPDAAEAFTRLAAASPGPHRDEVTSRAAELLDATGDDDGAASIWMTQAARSPRARTNAARALLRAHRYSEAADMGADVPWLVSDEAWNLIQDGQLEPALTVLDPAAARLGPDGLTLRAVSGGPPIAAVRIPWDGVHAGIEATLRIERIEWGAGVVIDVRDASRLGAAFRGWGGGGFLEHELGCPVLPDATRRVPRDQPGVDERWSVRLDLHDDELYCRVTGPDGTTTSNRRPLSARPASGHLVIQVRPARHAPEGHTLAAMTLEGLTVHATHPEALLTPPPDVGLPDMPHDVAGVRRLATADPNRLAALLRIDPAVLTPLLAQALGTGALPVFRDAHKGLQHAHPQDALTRRVYTVHAAPLLALPRGAETDSVRRARAELLTRRGQAWLGLGELEAARRDLLEAESITTGDPSLDLLAVDVAIERAVLAMPTDASAARAHALRAIARHPVPQIAADRVAARSELAALDSLWP